MTWYRLDPARRCFTLTLHIQPNARRTAPAGLYGDTLKLTVAAPPVDSHANGLLLDFLAKTFNVNRKQVLLKQGAHGRRKVVEIHGSDISPEILLKAHPTS